MNAPTIFPRIPPVHQLDDSRWPLCAKCSLGISTCRCVDYVPMNSRQDVIARAKEIGRG